MIATDRSRIHHKYQTIVFDFDYTLADSSRGVIECVSFALTSLGLPAASNEAISQTIGLSLTDTFVKLMGQANAAQAKEFAQLFTKHADKVMTVLHLNWNGKVLLPQLSALSKWVPWFNIV